MTNPAVDQWEAAWAEFKERLRRTQFFGSSAERVLDRPTELERRVGALEVALGLHLDEAAKFKAERAGPHGGQYQSTKPIVGKPGVQSPPTQWDLPRSNRSRRKWWHSV